MPKNQTNNQDPAPAMAPDHFRMILKIILKKKELSDKLQASSLTAVEGYCRMNLERIL